MGASRTVSVEDQNQNEGREYRELLEDFEEEMKYALESFSDKYGLGRERCELIDEGSLKSNSKNYRLVAGKNYSKMSVEVKPMESSHYEAKISNLGGWKTLQNLLMDEIYNERDIETVRGHWRSEDRTKRVFQIPRVKLD